MTTDPELTRIVRSWLSDGVTSVPDRVLDSVMAELPATPQRRRWLPARRDLLMNTYVRLAAAVAVVSILVVGGMVVSRPSLIGGPATPTPTTSPTSSPSKLLPLAPAAWCDYAKHTVAFKVTDGPHEAALEAARGGEPAEWRRLGPELLPPARQIRSALAGMEGLAPIASAVAEEGNALDGWIAALEDSFAADAGIPEIDRVYNTYAAWEDNRTRWLTWLRKNFETACP